MSSYPRLGFHQCLKFSDGTGGCNGCLNTYGMFLGNRPSCPTDPVLKTTNAGLGLLADLLEEVFTNQNFPSTAAKLPVSLKASGKSRADLWTFASAVALERGIDQNNLACDGVAPYRYHLRATEPDCKIEGKENIRFLTGRSDCSADTWETTREESHPNPHGNGSMTADFFKKDFGLTGREGAALLLGSHSFGTFNFGFSLFKYTWTRKQGGLFNNQLFRLLTNV